MKGRFKGGAISIRRSLLSFARDNETRFPRTPAREMGSFHYPYVLGLMELSCWKNARWEPFISQFITDVISRINMFLVNTWRDFPSLLILYLCEQRSVGFLPIISCSFSRFWSEIYNGSAKELSCSKTRCQINKTAVNVKCFQTVLIDDAINLNVTNKIEVIYLRKRLKIMNPYIFLDSILAWHNFFLLILT